MPGDFFEEDAADVERRRRAAAEAARAAELKKQSQVVQRGLPRPASLELLPEPRPDEALGRLSMRELAEEMLHRREVPGGGVLGRNPQESGGMVMPSMAAHGPPGLTLFMGPRAQRPGSGWGGWGVG